MFGAPLPTDDDVAFFRSHGYWISKPVLPLALLFKAEQGMERFYAGSWDRPMPDGSLPEGWEPKQGDVLRKNDYTSLLVNELAALVRFPWISASAAKLSGVPEIRLWHDQLLYKPSRTASSSPPAQVGWHTDRQYWQCCTSEQMITAWVPFHDIGPEHGGVSFLDKSHLWTDLPELDFHDPDLSRIDQLRRRFQVTVIEPPIPLGAVSFHHCRTVHGSGANRSGAPRRALAIHLQPGDNRHSGWSGDAKMGAHRNDRLCRKTDAGMPDYSDPGVCPTLFRGI